MATSTSPSSVDRPRTFSHDLDPALFTPERIDDLCRRAPTGTVRVQFGDATPERPRLEPIDTDLRVPVVADALDRNVQVRIFDVADWGGPGYVAARDALLRSVAPGASHGHHVVTAMIRVFSPGCIVALHGDPDPKIVCDVSGHTVWHVRPFDAMTPKEHEDLMRGGFFLRWRDCDEEEQLEIGPGEGCFVPCRWAHWLTHPGDEPIISFELGIWTHRALRLRKVNDVNWLMRRAHLTPRPPGEGRDGAKTRFFDVASTITRKGMHYRGGV